MGLVNQLGDFSKVISEHALPLRELLKNNNEFNLLQEHERSFEKIKLSLCETPILAQFDPSKETQLQTDASKNKGLGYVLLPKHGQDWKLVQCRSRFISDTESRH